MRAHEGVGDLVGFRDELFGCYSRWGDALFELTDGLLCETGPVHSVPSLSLEPEFSRSHGSLYKALAKGCLDEEALRKLLVENAPKDSPLVFAVDASTWARSDAECSPERGFHYSASRQLDATEATIDQVQRLVGLLPGDKDVPLFVFDAGYDAASLSEALADVRCEVLVHISSARRLPPRPDPRPGNARGRPARDGEGFVLADEAIWTAPDDELVLVEAMAPFVSAPGAGCTKSCTAGADARGRASCRSCAARSCASTSSICPSPPDAPTRRCGCGGRDLAKRTSNAAFMPIYADSTSSTRFDSKRHAGLDDATALHARASRPLELDRRRRVHRVANGPRPRGRPPAPLGRTMRPPWQAHAVSSVARISATACNPRHARCAAEIPNAGARTPKRNQKTAKDSPSGGQEGRLSGVEA
jgi:hypothetical protein